MPAASRLFAVSMHWTEHFTVTCGCRYGSTSDDVLRSARDSDGYVGLGVSFTERHAAPLSIGLLRVL